MDDSMCCADAHIGKYRCVKIYVGRACGMHGGEEIRKELIGG
jgi:hypothetical protein